MSIDSLGLVLSVTTSTGSRGGAGEAELPPPPTFGPTFQFEASYERGRNPLRLNRPEFCRHLGTMENGLI